MHGDKQPPISPPFHDVYRHNSKHKMENIYQHLLVKKSYRPTPKIHISVVIPNLLLVRPVINKQYLIIFN